MLLILQHWDVEISARKTFYGVSIRHGADLKIGMNGKAMSSCCRLQCIQCRHICRIIVFPSLGVKEYMLNKCTGFEERLQRRSTLS